MGTYLKTYSNISGHSRVLHRYGYVSDKIGSKPRYRTNNDYVSHAWQRVRGDNSSYYGAYDYSILMASAGFIPTKLYNRVYAKLVDELGEQSELLTASLEWKSSLAMITNRLKQIRTAHGHLRKWNLPGFFETLAIKPDSRRVPKSIRTYAARKNIPAHLLWRLPGKRNPQKVSKPQFRRMNRASKTHLVSSAWLEYWLGWAPSIGDIQTAWSILTRDFPGSEGFKVTSGEKYYRKVVVNGSSGPGSNGYHDYIVKGSTTLGLYGKVRITNYNVILANQLGLLNPALTAFQLAPLSFVLGWFINLEQKLGQLTDFAGYTIWDTGYGTRQDGNIQGRQYVREYVSGSYRVIRKDYTIEGVSKTRTPATIKPPELVVKFDRLSLERGLTAASLLNELFIKPY